MNCANTAPLILLTLVSIGVNILQLFAGMALIGMLIDERRKRP